ncbi:MAG TPA: aminotransferase class I/II-fold pyridoxal phosphate-dependent enzyme, partial [Thermoanaerobaculia bacterium]|nr:aminotransferase class I/II-fold pyridoxal phosphate-dependent enzyme [Thermoanaerobaculia bacterium]
SPEGRMSRDVVAAMTAYTLELREAEIKLNQNESPNDFPAELKQQILARVAARPWNLYPDFESMTLREALARAHGYEPANILVGNGSNELLAATIATFVGPGTPVVFPKPTFALYEKLVTIAGGIPIPIAIDPSTGLLPLDAMCGAADSAANPVIIACSPNNPTGGVLPPNGIDALLATGATVLFDRAYGDFNDAQAGMPALHDRLVTFSTFSKAWGLAALRVGWLASTASTCREIRKVKLPYSLNIVSEAIAATALENRQVYERNVSLAIRERKRVFVAMQKIAGVTPCPSKANFIFFRVAQPRRAFDALCERGVLIREYADALRVSIGNPYENDRFLAALQEVP